LKIGGAASGIGLACARVMAANGARLTLLDCDEASLAAAIKELTATGAEVRGDIVDVTDRDRLDRSFDRAARAHGRIDVAFANAGIGGGPGFLSMDGQRNPAGAIEDIGPERWNTMLDTNLLSALWTIQAAVRQMKLQGGGRIIVTTSIAAIKTETHVGLPYMVAKFGLVHLVKQAALELARYNILVNAIAPGPFATNIGGGRMLEDAMQNHHRRVTPLRRMAKPNDIMGLALFLASPASSFVTGTQIVIDGGATLGFAD
jgi:NAD(P)-dependent dehydrogenase (short-subunit alcohol dehydrogenase family)